MLKIRIANYCWTTKQRTRNSFYSAPLRLCVKLSLLFSLALLLVACDGVYSGTLIFAGEHQFGPETRLPGDVAMRAGVAEFAAGSRVDGSIYVVGGTLRLNGMVGGDVVILDGRVTLGPDLVIGGDLRLGGGEVVGVETAVIRGETISGAIALPPEATETRAGWDGLARTWAGALLLAALGGLWANWRPQPLRRTAATTTAHWPATLALGLLALLTLPVLLVLMAFTIVLLPLVLLLLLALFLMLGMGIIALGLRLGEAVAVWRGWSWSAGRATFVGTLLLLGLFNLPVAGGVLAVITAVFLFGAVLLTRFGTHEFHPPDRLTAETDLASYARGAPE